jgi:sulfonate transport system ATP-binding protein
LARALVAEPELLLLDEPFGALDALTRLSMRELLLKLWREHDFGVLLVTHDVDEAVALADRVLVLEDGRIVHTLDIDEPRTTTHADRHRTELLAQLGVHA